MPESPAKRNSRDEERDLHRRLVEGDPVASSELAQSYLESLVKWVTRHNSTIDEHLCMEAADEAILALIRRPTSYQPDLSPLEDFLRISAQADLRNLLARESKRRNRQKSWNVVELGDDARNYLRVQDVQDPPLEAHEDRVRWQALIDGESSKMTGIERQVLHLMLQGERRTSVYAEVCNVANLSTDEQKREVNRIKNRVKARLKRAGRKL